jgi:hypothetical protein
MPKHTHGVYDFATHHTRVTKRNRNSRLHITMCIHFLLSPCTVHQLIPHYNNDINSIHNCSTWTQIFHHNTVTVYWHMCNILCMWNYWICAVQPTDVNLSGKPKSCTSGHSLSTPPPTSSTSRVNWDSSLYSHWLI